jgi:hypothetical protein
MNTHKITKISDFMKLSPDEINRMLLNQLNCMVQA